MSRSHLIAAGVALLSMSAHAQGKAGPQSMGTVATRDALVTGGLEVRGERAALLSNAAITAYDRTADIELARGGEVLVCSTSQFHLLHSGTELSLLFGLDRGAVEIHGRSQPQDVVLTPDLRFTFATTGDLDVRLRVTANGDTCVENAGASAPVIAVNDVFSDASYRLLPGQHVLFEHGSLHEVVDHERSPCGCPAPPAAPPVQVAQAASGTPTTADQADARNPFPSAVSQGLAPETKPANNVAPAGEAHAQVSGTLAYGNTGSDVAAPAPPATPAAATTAPAGPPPSPPGAHDLAHMIGGFFHRLFHRKGA